MCLNVFTRRRKKVVYWCVHSYIWPTTHYTTETDWTSWSPCPHYLRFNIGGVVPHGTGVLWSAGGERYWVTLPTDYRQEPRRDVYHWRSSRCYCVSSPSTQGQRKVVVTWLRQIFKNPGLGSLLVLYRNQEMENSSEKRSLKGRSLTVLFFIKLPFPPVNHGR